MAKSAKKFMTHKEIFNRGNQDFAANGIECAGREVHVALLSMDNPDRTEEDTQAIAVAACQAVQDIAPPTGTKT